MSHWLTKESRPNVAWKVATEDSARRYLERSLRSLLADYDQVRDEWFGPEILDTLIDPLDQNAVPGPKCRETLADAIDWVIDEVLDDALAVRYLPQVIDRQARRVVTRNP